MILEPWKSPQEIERRLAALNDPELEELLRSANRELTGAKTEIFTAPEAPYWKKRAALIALMGLIAMSAGYAGSLSHSPRHTGVKPAAAVAPVRRPAGHAARHVAAVPRIAPSHRAAVPHQRAAVATVVAAPAPVQPSEALIRQARAQLMREREIAAQARAQTAIAEHNAKVALRAQAAAQAQAQTEALAQARAEAVAQAKAEELAQSQAQALARAQQEAIDAERAQEQAVQNASDPNIKPGEGPPPSSGRISTYPSAGVPVPAPGPVDPNCTPHRGSLLVNTVLDHVRVGGTSVGGLLRLIHP